MTTMSEKLTDAEARASAPTQPHAASSRATAAPAASRTARSRSRSRSSTCATCSVYYGDHRAIRDVSMRITKHEITALIGPSGCGKSTFIRCLNRMNDLIPSARVEGEIVYHGEDLYDARIDPVQVRKRIGMVFQKPNPFPKSIYENIAFGPRVIGMKGDMDEIVESALRRAALWDETKDRLKTNAFGMSGGQQQRLCIARALATQPDVLLMDEPCSALDPISTGRIEDLMMELKQSYSIVIVTHNMQQAARVSDMTAFFTVELDESAKTRTGRGRRVRRDRQDLHEPRGQAHGGLRHREVRLMARRRLAGSTSRTSSARSRSRRSARSTWSCRRSTACSRRSSTRTSSSRRSSSRTTTGSTGATWRSTRGSSRCSRCRRLWPATCAWWRRCCT